MDGTLNAITRWLKYTAVVLDDSSCWNWQGAIVDRYGVLRVNTKKQKAHRFGFLLGHGRPPGKKYVCHKCDNTHCVRPSHLFLGTQKENMADMIQKGRGPVVVGSRNPKSKLSEEDVKRIRELYPEMQQKEIGKLFGISQGQVSKIVLKQGWGHVG